MRDGKEPPKKEEPKQQEQPIYTQQEIAALEAYHKDWPDVAAAEALKRRGEYRALTDFIFSQVAPVFKQMQETIDQLSARAQYGDLKETIPEYTDALVDKVTAWAEAQPSYLRDAYKSVITSGSPQDVTDLVKRYRAETGDNVTQQTQQQQQTQRAQVPAKPKAELPPGTKQAAAAMAPVSSKRSAVAASVDPSDFNGAFDQYAKQGL